MGLRFQQRPIFCSPYRHWWHLNTKVIFLIGQNNHTNCRVWLEYCRYGVTPPPPKKINQSTVFWPRWQNFSKTCTWLISWITDGVMATNALLTCLMATMDPWYLAVLVNICWAPDISVFILIDCDLLVLVSFKKDDWNQNPAHFYNDSTILNLD